MQKVPRPPRKPQGALTRRTYLSAPITASLLLGLLDDLPSREQVSVIGVLLRLVDYSSPWTMLAPFSLWLAAYGLLAALQSGELPGSDSAAIRRLSLHDLCVLITDIASSCRHPQDVPFYLVARALGQVA